MCLEATPYFSHAARIVPAAAFAELRPLLPPFNAATNSAKRIEISRSLSCLTGSVR